MTWSPYGLGVAETMILNRREYNLWTPTVETSWRKGMEEASETVQKMIETNREISQSNLRFKTEILTMPQTYGVTSIVIIFIITFVIFKLMKGRSGTNTSPININIGPTAPAETTVGQSVRIEHQSLYPQIETKPANSTLSKQNRLG